MPRERFTNHFSTTLSGTITSGATSLSVASATGLPTAGNFRIRVESEIMTVTAISGTTLTVTRGAEGTTAAAHNSGVAVDHILTAASLQKAVEENLAIGTVEGRLSLATATPITTSDQAAKTTIYYTPWNGNRIGLYDGSTWRMYPTAEVSKALGTLTSGKNYDVFAYYDSATDAVVLEFSAAWTSDTARADALTTQDGVLVKSGSTTRRYLGTFRTSSTTQTEDTVSQRYVWNYYNRQRRRMTYHDTTASWTYNSTTPRQTRGQSTAKVSYVVGLAGIWLDSRIIFLTTGATSGAVGVGLGNTTPVKDCHFYHSPNKTNAPQSTYSGYSALGYNEIWPLEWGVDALNAWTYYSNSAGSIRSGLQVFIEG